MTDLATLQPGQTVWTKGSGPFGGSRTGGCIVRTDADQGTGEAFVLIITNSPARPRQGFVYLRSPKGSVDSLGLVARLERVAVNDIDPYATDDFPDYRRVWGWAVAALRAASLPPNDRWGSKGHDDLHEAYRVLRPIAESIRRGIA